MVSKRTASKASKLPKVEKEKEKEEKKKTKEKPPVSKPSTEKSKPSVITVAPLKSSKADPQPIAPVKKKATEEAKSTQDLRKDDPIK